jgi:hypothetical protein
LKGEIKKAKSLSFGIMWSFYHGALWGRWGGWRVFHVSGGKRITRERASVHDSQGSLVEQWVAGCNERLGTDDGDDKKLKLANSKCFSGRAAAII